MTIQISVRKTTFYDKSSFFKNNWRCVSNRLRHYQQNKSSESKVKFRHASNCCKRVLEAVKLAYATETKQSITSHKLLALETFGELLIMFSAKVNLLYLLDSLDWRCCLLHLIN